ncbi:MAG TPA: M56 family metallopeptidase [Fimbriimonas sp.]|nr:M56 family metallopeptidase [Fimbriimonas sp.]
MNVVNSIGWTLIHSVWELALAALALLVAGYFLKKASASVRYLVALMALGVCVLAPGATYCTLNQRTSTIEVPTPTHPVKPSQTVGLRLASTRSSTSAPSPTLERRLEPVLPVVVRVWVIGLLLMGVRLLAGLAGIERLKRKASAGLDPRWQAVGEHFARRLGLNRPLSVLVSEAVDSPSVVGFAKAVVLLPAGVILRMSPQSVEALLAHEIAHIRRHDYFVNLMQSIVEALLFFHPAVWWISSVVRKEREHCCDDLAVYLTGDRAGYARALVALEEMRTTSPRLAVAADGRPLLARIRRILIGQSSSTGAGSLWPAFVLVVAISAVLAQRLYAGQTSRVDVHVRRIHGHVQTATGAPARGALVVYNGVAAGKADWWETKSVTCDRNGDFDVEVGRGFLGASAYLKGEGLGFLWPSGDVNVGIKLLRPTVARLRFVTKDGKPAANVKIMPIEAVIGQRGYDLRLPISEAMARVTDRQGRVTIPDVPFTQGMRFDADDDRFAKGLFTEARADKETTITLEPACELTGVVRADGNPVADASIIVFDSRHSGGVVRTEADGRFVAKRLREGDSIVLTELPKGVKENWAAGPKNVRLHVGANAPITISAEKGGLVVGRVIDEKGAPLKDAVLRFFDSKASFATEAVSRSDSEGKFSQRLPAGTHSIRCDTAGSMGEVALDLKGGETKEGTVRMVMQAPKEQFVCHVVDSEYKPVPNAFIDYRYRYEHGLWAGSGTDTDENGDATFEVTKEQAKSVRVSVRVGSLFSDPEIRPVGNRFDIKLHRVSLSSIQGVIRDSDGRPIEDADVAIGIGGGVQFVGDLDTMGKWNRKVDPNGSFRFEGLYPGIRVTVMARAPGHADVQTSEIVVGTGKRHTLPDLVMPKGGTLRGRVVDQNGRPIADARLCMENISRIKDIWAKTDKEGRFKFDYVPLTTVKLAIYKGYNEIHPLAKVGSDSTYTLKPSR